MPKLEQFEIKKYWQIFSGLKPKDNKYLSYEQVKPILYNSKLDSSILSQIWDLSDIDDDDCLDFEEFVICMRLIFDMVNKTINEIPKKLPDWLIPGSKGEILKQKELNKLKEQKEFSSGETQQELPHSVVEPTKNYDSVVAAPVVNEKPIIQHEQKIQQVEEEEEEVRPDVDWYIAPHDKSLYETLYTTSTLNMDGTISFDALVNKLKYTILISNLNDIKEVDLIKIWNLCNPSKHESIDKDPTLYFMHIVKQMNDKNCKIPVELPTGLKKSFHKDQVETSLNSKQSVVKKTPIYLSSSETPSSTATGTNATSSFSKKITEGTDFSSTEDTDWELVRLKKELNSLDRQYEDAMDQSRSLTSGDTHLSLIKKQFQELLSYKQKQILERSNSSPNTAQNKTKLIRDELDNIEDQISVLQNYLTSRQEVLQNINQQVSSA